MRFRSGHAFEFRSAARSAKIYIVGSARAASVPNAASGADAIAAATTDGVGGAVTAGRNCFGLGYNHRVAIACSAAAQNMPEIAAVNLVLITPSPVGGVGGGGGAYAVAPAAVAMTFAGLA